MDTKHKKEQFAGKNRSVLQIILGAAVVIVVVIAVVYFSADSSNGGTNGNYVFGESVAVPRSYVGKTVEMTKVEPLIEGEQLIIPFNVIDENDAISFEAENDEGFLVPYIAYITPSGRLFAGSSMCEPCSGREFYLAGETLVCKKCNTTYNIEDHEFIRGSSACGSYPPVYLEPELIDDMVVIDMEKILSWRIRAY